MKPKCGIYYRVSTEEQDLKMQKANLPKYARQRGWQIVGKYEDNGISGSSIEARPGFKKMLDDLQSGKFQFLVVNETSRVTRADSAAERGLIIDLLMKHKITLSAPMEVDVDPNTAMGEKYLADAFWMAKQERRNIAKRMADGRCEKMKKGIPMYRGQRYGRRFWVEKHSSKNPEDWEVRWEITDQDKIDRIRKGGLFMLKTHCGWRKAAEHSGAISHKTLRQVILNQGGSKMIQRNAVKALDIEETFEFEIPEEVRIFDDITRQKILDVAKENTSYRAGTPPKYDFLLRRVLIDPDGHAIEAMPKGKR